MSNLDNAPTTGADFNRAYRLPFTFWGDTRIPPEVKVSAMQNHAQTSLELGCGIGRVSRYLARQGIHATGVDFSSVAIGKARSLAARDAAAPTFMVGDVTHLDTLQEPFDFAFDIGCFHCLGTESQQKYVSEVLRLLKPGATHLIWAIDAAPGNVLLSPEAIRLIFAPSFTLKKAKSSRRRIIASHWYWLVRSPD